MTLQAGFSCHSPTTCFFLNFPFFIDFQTVHMLILQVGFWFLTLHADVCFTLSNHMLAFFFFFRKIIFHGVATFLFHTLRPGFRFSLTMHICGLHSPSRCEIFKMFLFSKLIFHGVFILSLSNQVLGSHSPCTYSVYTLQANVGFLKCFYFNLNFSWGFHPLTLQPGFRFSLSI